MDEGLDSLLNKVKSGNKKAFQELYTLYYKRVYYFALQISKNSQDAQDITQETFVQLQKSLPNLKENRAFSVWLHRIIISKAGTLFRKHKEIAIPDDHYEFKKNREERGYMLPNETMHFESDKEMLHYFLNQLDEKYRVVLTLSYLEGLKIKEIAEILDVPEGTIKSRTNTAKELLKEKIEKYQKREGVRLDFTSIDVAGILTAFFIAEVATIQIPSYSSLLAPRWNNTFINGIGLQVAGTCAMIAVGVTVTLGAYQIYQSQQNLEVPKSVISDPQTQLSFPEVNYKNRMYDNPEDAYYELLLWAHCEVEMEEYTLEERMLIKPLFEALMKENGVYWKELNRKGWVENFQKFLKK